jgi:hypothetical protein
VSGLIGFIGPCFGVYFFSKDPEILSLRRVPVAYTMYRIISVAPSPLGGSFTIESPLRIIFLITSQQTDILFEFGSSPTCV